MAAVLYLLPLLSAARADIENGVVGSPEVRCGTDSIVVVASTVHPFGGRLYVQGEAENPECIKRPKTTTGDTIEFELGFGACGMRRQRTLSPRGVTYSFTLVVSFHPVFVTGIDRGFNVRCFFLESVKDLETAVDVGRLTTTIIEQDFSLPTCTYSIHQGGASGPPIKYARVGEAVSHVWDCGNAAAAYAILIHSCAVDDGAGKKFELVDDRGCSLDTTLLPVIDYDKGALQASASSSIFKYADKIQVFFTCTVQLCFKTDGGCDGLTPPQCGGGLHIPGVSLASSEEHGLDHKLSTLATSREDEEERRPHHGPPPRRPPASEEDEDSREHRHRPEHPHEDRPEHPQEHRPELPKDLPHGFPPRSEPPPPVLLPFSGGGQPPHNGEDRDRDHPHRPPPHYPRGHDSGERRDDSRERRPPPRHPDDSHEAPRHRGDHGGPPPRFGPQERRGGPPPPPRERDDRREGGGGPPRGLFPEGLELKPVSTAEDFEKAFEGAPRPKEFFGPIDPSRLPFQDRVKDSPLRPNSDSSAEKADSKLLVLTKTDGKKIPIPDEASSPLPTTAEALASETTEAESESTTIPAKAAAAKNSPLDHAIAVASAEYEDDNDVDELAVDTIADIAALLNDTTTSAERMDRVRATPRYRTDFVSSTLSSLFNDLVAEEVDAKISTVDDGDSTSTANSTVTPEEMTTIQDSVTSIRSSRDSAEPLKKKKIETDLSVDVIVLPIDDTDRPSGTSSLSSPPAPPLFCLSVLGSSLIAAGLAVTFIVAAIASVFIARRGRRRSPPMMLRKGGEHLF